jgi:hypothetical protein
LSALDGAAPGEAHALPAPVGAAGAGLHARFGIGRIHVRVAEGTRGQLRHHAAFAARTAPHPHRFRRRGLSLQRALCERVVHELGRRRRCGWRHRGLPRAFERGEQARAKLRHRERHRDEDQRGVRAEPEPAQRAREAPLRHRAPQRLGCEHEQPHPVGRAGLGVDERERRECEAAAQRAEQAQRRHRHDHHHEQVEQGPARDPRRLRAVHARGVQQAPAGRQLERGCEPVEVGVPAHRGEPPRAGLDAAVGVERDGPERQLDTGECQPRPRRNGLVHAVHGGTPERGGEAHLEPGGAPQLALDAVGHGGAAAVEVEVPGAGERELVGPAARVSAPLLDEAQLAARLDAVRR